jgi:hypothetical protein
MIRICIRKRPLSAQEREERGAANKAGLQQQCRNPSRSGRVVGSRVDAARGRGGRRGEQQGATPKRRREQQGAHDGAWREPRLGVAVPLPRHRMSPRLAGEERRRAPRLGGGGGHDHCDSGDGRTSLPGEICPRLSCSALRYGQHRRARGGGGVAVEEAVESVGEKAAGSSEQGGGALPPDPVSAVWGVVGAGAGRHPGEVGAEVGSEPAAEVGSGSGDRGGEQSGGRGWRRRTTGWRSWSRHPAGEREVAGGRRGGGGGGDRGGSEERRGGGEGGGSAGAGGGSG